MTEYAILSKSGSIINVVTAQDRLREDVWLTMPNAVKVVPLDDVPLYTTQNYQYWDERP